VRQFQEMLEIETRGAGLWEITRDVLALARRSGIGMGLATIFVQHTSCSLLVQENAAPDARRDLEEFFRRIAPEGLDWVRHDDEGPDDMPAHIRAALTQTSLGVPVAEGRLMLGTWQGIYLFEHRRQPHRRRIVVHVIGE